METDPTETESTPATRRRKQKSNGFTPSPILVSSEEWKVIEVRLECLRIVAHRASEREMESPEVIAEKCFEWVMKNVFPIESTG